MQNQYGYTPVMNQINQYSPTIQQQSTYNQRPEQIQQQFQSEENQRASNTTSIRRNSRVLTPQDRPANTGIGQTLNDR
jgi:junctophilin